MSKLTVYDMKGGSAGQLDVDDDILVTDRGDHALHLVVLAYQAAQRSGTADTKGKGAVAGSNKKPWKQKGTGRARAGYRQSPVWRGGGVAHGPHPRSYEQKVNKKVAQLALRRALGDRVSSGALKVVEDFKIVGAKTKQFLAALKALSVQAPMLIVVDRIEDSLRLASRNVPNVEVLNAQDLNVYHIVRYPTIVVTRAGFGQLVKRMGAGRTTEVAA